MKQRQASKVRITKETDITLDLCLDGTGISRLNTGIGFLDHMLNGFARHGLFDLNATCTGDLIVDSHHTVEDIGIVLGEVIAQAIGNKEKIRRYGHTILPMDDALILCAVDLSGRPYFSWDVNFTVPKLGELDTEMIRDFFYAISYSGEMNLHIKQLDGFNNHHIAEGIFKAFAKSLDMAVSYDQRIDGILTTKGML